MKERKILIEKGSEGRTGHSEFLFNYEKGTVEEIN